MVILLLRGYDDVGATVIGVLHRYTEALQANDGKLVLAGVSPALRDQLQRTGILNLIGEKNLFPATQTIGESGNVALDAARAWLQEESFGEDKSEEQENGVPEGTARSAKAIDQTS